MCSCLEAYSSLRPCAILVVGVSGSLPVHGIGTANFLVKNNEGMECIWKIHNCLLCHKTSEEEQFNLISVSQILRTGNNAVTFGNETSKITVQPGKRKEEHVFPLVPDDGLYSITCVPICDTDARFKSMRCISITLDDDKMVSGESKGHCVADDTPRDTLGLIARKSPSRLGSWTVKVLWIGKRLALGAVSQGFGTELADFCDSYIAPLSIPKARKTYEVNNIEDMSDLSVRFFGIGTERLQKTLERSIGLSPMVKVKGKMRNVVPVHNFPQGSWKKGKTPRVSKGIVHDMHRAAIGEVLFMDTFEVEDAGYGYAQAFIDYRSKFGEVIPLKSRSQVGWSFAEFCARHYIPLILVRDNIGENIGGDLMVQCQKRSVRSAYICPYKKQQNYAEGYIGRITALASYGMVFSGAPMFMWRWCIACAVFVNNITATFYSAENVWATPYEVIFNEPFPDSSIVVPFGCGVLVLLTDEEQGKFKSKCALMIFIHYATQHPLYTYAVYSPRTKRVLFRQDCIFLTNLFPMRTARARDGMNLDGDKIIPYRAPASIREGGDEELSFRNWDESAPLPDFQDHVTGHQLINPPMRKTESTAPYPEDGAYIHPDNQFFGPPSVVKVPLRGKKTNRPDPDLGERLLPDLGPDMREMQQGQEDPGITMEQPKSRSVRAPSINRTTVNGSKRRPVKDRWYYEAVLPSTPLLAAAIESKSQVVGEEDSGAVGSDDEEELKWYNQNKELMEALFNATDKYEAAIAIQPAETYQKSMREDPECTLPLDIGEVLTMSLSEIEGVPVDEYGAAYLQGVLFYDAELLWCRINGWGVECGIPIVHYSPVESNEPSADEQHISVFDILEWMKTSTVPSGVPKLEPSRILKQAGPIVKSLWYRQKSRLPVSALISSVGAYIPIALGARMVSYDGKPLSTKTIRRILRAQETIFKYGTMIPRNDAEASRSPEAVRWWMSGKQLEWLRLKQARTFETNWTWAMVRQHYPDYKKTDIGHLFFIYDYKFSGEHRVRLVFDGSRQSEATYNETYAPTVRPESVRLFHIYAVEYAWTIQQYDVPQAFLRSDADCDIFCAPPNGFAEFPGQLLKLSKMLYGSKQAAALWYSLINGFLLEMGFTASEMDPCFYRRAIISNAGSSPCSDACSDAIIILHVDDMRVAGPAAVVSDIHDKLFTKFEITTSDTGRFLGMDAEYDTVAGVLRMHMKTYIESAADRFTKFDLSHGIPYREIVGSLLWIVLCIHGPELLRVKDLARKSNNFTREDYDRAIHALQRLVDRKDMGIIYRKGGAGKETVPANTRLGGVKNEDIEQVPVLISSSTTAYSTGDQASICELKEHDLYKLDATIDDIDLDIQKVLAPTNKRFTVVAYADASFAVGELKQSISGFDVMINGTPLLWGSLKQTAVVDATCSAEYVASSICCKQIVQAENMVQFLNFTCPKPYTLYTDSQACLHIANSASKLGKVRHVEIRYHLVRCLVISGDIRLFYCITEDMIADIFTKIVAGAQDKRLSVRFYNDCDVLLFGQEIN